MRLRLAAQVILGTLLISALAGCSSAPAAEASGGEVKYGYVDADNKTHGFVAGIVLSEAGEPVTGALVLILSMDGSATTDSAGKFNFTDVAKGEQALRVEKQGYKTIQRPFSVVAGKIVEIEVVLARVEGLDGGLIDHYHDKWRGQELYTVYEGRIELDKDVTQDRRRDYAVVPDDGRIVPPGTVKISIDISFAPGPLGDQESRRVFSLYPPPGPSGASYEEQIWRLSSGKHHLEYDLPSSEITDHGHATYTSWAFTISTYDPSMLNSWHPWYDLLFGSPFDITITAHKGALVIDPPHPKYWADTNRIEMPTGPETSFWCDVPGAHAWNCQDRSPNPDVRYGGTVATRTCQVGCMVLERGGLVPPGATGVSFDLEMWQGTATAGTEPAASGTDWVLGFKTAATPRGGAMWDDYTWVEPVETFEPDPQQDRYHAQGLRYMIDVPAGGEDPFYTAFSAWIFMMAVKGHETANDWSDMTCSTYACGRPHFELKNFVVHNDSPASEMEPE